VTETEGGAPQPKRPSDWFSVSKKAGEYLLGVMQLKRSVETLTKQNEKQQEQIARLQRQVDEQAGQLKALQGFIQTAVYEQAARSGERAAYALFQELLPPPSGKK
jgi:chaperonin cofactor prefoldin